VEIKDLVHDPESKNPAVTKSGSAVGLPQKLNLPVSFGRYHAPDCFLNALRKLRALIG